MDNSQRRRVGPLGFMRDSIHRMEHIINDHFSEVEREPYVVYVSSPYHYHGIYSASYSSHSVPVQSTTYHYYSTHSSPCVTPPKKPTKKTPQIRGDYVQNEVTVTSIEEVNGDMDGDRTPLPKVEIVDEVPFIPRARQNQNCTIEEIDNIPTPEQNHSKFNYPEERIIKETKEENKFVTRDEERLKEKKK